MDQELERIIGLFNSAQEKSIEVLEQEFSCHRPETSDDFIFRCVPIIREANYVVGGYKIRPHGIGMEINLNGISIDFDFGANGEFTGFDAWRLYGFIQNNKIQSSISSEEEMDKLISNAFSQGHIVKSAGVYYANS